MKRIKLIKQTQIQSILDCCPVHNKWHHMAVCVDDEEMTIGTLAFR